MPDGSLHAFGGEALKPKKPYAGGGEQPAVEEKLGDGPTLEEFAQDIEGMVCAKVNDVPFANANGLIRLPMLDPEDMSRRGQSQPQAMARHFACFILTHHPFAEGRFSTTSLGARYSRDHTTVVSGLARADGLIHARHKVARLVQRELDLREGIYGPFNMKNRTVSPLELRRARLKAFYRSRAAKMVSLRMSGLSSKAIAKQYGLTENRVQEVIRLHLLAVGQGKQETASCS